MYKTPRINNDCISSLNKSEGSHTITDGFLQNLFENPTIRMNINNFLRTLFQALIQEFYPYILTTLCFMLISFILLISIFIMILWREKY
jgi:hypothetical protein